MTPAQTRFICALARVRPTDAHLQQAVELAPLDEEWPALVDALISHGVAPLVWRNLPNELRSKIPAPERERLERIRLATLAFYLRAERALLHALDVLQPLGIQPIVLKGMALAERLYGRPDLRPMCDVDLYVPEERLDEAGRALVAAGAVTAARRTRVERAHYEWVFTFDGIIVELHRWFAHPPRYPLDYCSMRQRTVPFALQGRPMLHLSTEDELIQLCIHMATHYFAVQLKWIVDLHEVISRFRVDWRLLVNRAQQHKARVACCIALSAAKILLGTNVPSEVLSVLSPSLPRRLWLRALLDMQSPQIARIVGPHWLQQLLLGLPLCDSPWRAIPFAFRYEWLKLLDALTQPSPRELE